MIYRGDYKYLTLDGMPYIITPDDKTWVFARTTQKWEPADDEDDWDAVYPNWDSWWEDMFAELPELPEGAITEQAIKSDVKTIDILKMELEQNLPYWLSSEAKNAHKRDAIRAKHRAKYLAKQAADRLAEDKTRDEADHPRGQPENTGEFAPEQTPKQSTKPPYEDMPLDNLVDRTSERRGRGYVIGGAPSAKPRGKNS